MTDPTCPRCQSRAVTRHVMPIPAKCEAERYAPVAEEGYRCSDCAHQESKENFAPDYLEFRERWRDLAPEVPFETRQAELDELNSIWERNEREFTWPREGNLTNRDHRERRLAKSRIWVDHAGLVTQLLYKEFLKPKPEHKYGFPVGEEFTRAVCESPDDDAPRREYARWLRGFSDPRAKGYADFIDFQIRMAELWRADPKCDPRRVAPDVCAHVGYHQPWWRVPADHFDGDGPGESTKVLEFEGAIADPLFYRGFVEHVTIKAERLLEIADELFGLAPIRHLTVTYCKGRDHQDAGLWKRFLASPHLERIRSLRMPKRAWGSDNDYTELNRFSDGDIALLAQSPRLAGLRVLDLEDQSRLTWRAFDALAESKNLPALSHVKHDIFSYYGKVPSPWGLLGTTKRSEPHRKLHEYTAELERRHGHVVWLHPVDYYGSEDPDIEAVTEHPLALKRNR